MRPTKLLSATALILALLTLGGDSASAKCGLLGRLFHRRARAQAVCVPAGYGYGYRVNTWAAGTGCYSGGYATMGGCYGGYVYQPSPPACPIGQGLTPSPQGDNELSPAPAPQPPPGLPPGPPGKGMPPVPGKTLGQPGPGQHVDCQCGDPQCSHTFGQCGCNNPKCICHPDRPPTPGGVTPTPPAAPIAPVAPVTPEPVVPNRPHHGRR